MSSEHNRHEGDFNLHDKDRRFAGLARTGRGSKASHGIPKAQRREFARELSGYPLFSRCSPADLDALISHCQQFALPANWLMIKEATPADACYVIISGDARVVRGGEAVADLKRGDVVGEMAVLTGALRRASVSTLTRVTGLRVSNDELVRLFHERPSLLEAMRHEFQVRSARASRAFRPVPLVAHA